MAAAEGPRGQTDRQTAREERENISLSDGDKKNGLDVGQVGEENEEDMRKNGMVFSPPPRNTLLKPTVLGLLTRADALDHLDAAPLADVDRRQRQGPVEGVAAGRVRVAVALEAPHPAPG